MGRSRHHPRRNIGLAALSGERDPGRSTTAAGCSCSPSRTGSRSKRRCCAGCWSGFGCRPFHNGFRSSFRDWVAEETDHPREVAEAALAHLVRNPGRGSLRPLGPVRTAAAPDGRLGAVRRRRSHSASSHRGTHGTCARRNHSTLSTTEPNPTCPPFDQPPSTSQSVGDHGRSFSAVGSGAGSRTGRRAREGPGERRRRSSVGQNEAGDTIRGEQNTGSSQLSGEEPAYPLCTQGAGEGLRPSTPGRRHGATPRRFWASRRRKRTVARRRQPAGAGPPRALRPFG